MKKTTKMVLVLIALITLPVSIFSQMSDWKFFRDRDGNGYYYDGAFKIRIVDDKVFNYQPVTIKGMDFFLNSGIDLIKTGRIREGLYFLKSLKLLESDNMRVIKTKNEASRWINDLMKKQGERFNEYDDDSTVLMVRNETNYAVVNEKLFYKMKLNTRPHIISREWKLNKKAYGIKIGMNISDAEKKEGYDYMIGVESRIYSFPVNGIDGAIEAWRVEMGRDTLKRIELSKKNDRIIYYYEYPDGSPFSGIEGIYTNRNMIHIIRGLCHNSLKQKVFDDMERAVQEIIMVN
jgi:hypothetical protein